MRITANNIVRAIGKLPRNVHYQYVSSRNSGRIVIVDVVEPEGPIKFKRYDPNKNENHEDKRVETISKKMIARLAGAILPDMPVNIDRALAGSYNTRSVLEALLAHTPSFYSCKPGRIEWLNTEKHVKPGHKHLIYSADTPHENGVLGRRDVEMQISELAVDTVYRTITLDPKQTPKNLTEEDLEVRSKHARIQASLVIIGQILGFNTWVAQNDRGIRCGDKSLAEFDNVIADLPAEQVLSAYPSAAQAALFIDCIWFKNGKLMPAVMEIEHSTSITSGLSRMKNFYDHGPPIRDVRWVIVAPDEDRDRVVEKANQPQFRDLKAKFFPYTAVSELYSLCDRRRPSGITDDFLDCFMENCVQEA